MALIALTLISSLNIASAAVFLGIPLGLWAGVLPAYAAAGALYGLGAMVFWIGLRKEERAKNPFVGIIGDDMKSVEIAQA